MCWMHTIHPVCMYGGNDITSDPFGKCTTTTGGKIMRDNCPPLFGGTESLYYYHEKGAIQQSCGQTIKPTLLVPEVPG